MKIVTVNIPESFIDAIERLIGENGLYPSRSELIRAAVREFLLKELKMSKDLSVRTEPKFEKSLDEDKYVRIPVDNEGDDDSIRQFKTYKIIKRLEY